MFGEVSVTAADGVADVLPRIERVGVKNNNDIIILKRKNKKKNQNERNIPKNIILCFVSQSQKVRSWFFPLLSLTTK